MGKKQDWYAKSPADYKMDTGRLVMIEHGAYNLLLDRYYHDGFLPSDDEQLFNICSTRDEQEEAAVKRVKGMFFTVDGKYLKHKRVEEELQKTRELIGKKSAAGLASAVARGLKKKEKLTRVEQRSTNTVHNSTTQDSFSGPSGPRSAGAEHPGPSLPNALQNPTPVVIATSDPVKAESSKELKKTARGILSYLNQATGKKFHEVDSNLDPIVARLKEGVTELQIKSVIFDRCQAWATDEKMHEFLRPETIFRRSKFWNYLGNITTLDTESHSRVESTSPVLQRERQPGEDDLE